MGQKGESRLDRIEAILERMATRVDDHDRYFDRVFEGFDRVAGNFGQIHETVERVVTIVGAADESTEERRHAGHEEVARVVESLCRTDRNIERIITLVETLIEDAKDQRRQAEEQRKRIDDLEGAVKRLSDTQERVDESLGSLIRIMDELIRKRLPDESQQ